MEGIITGIGDKELGKNLIKPEYDAVINDFIIGKNTILEGLILNGNNLSAGTCILCGYRGIIEENKTLDTTAYIYGEFTINFNTEIEDSFNIVTSTTAITTNLNPTEITSAGTYYLLLYENGESQIDREHPYPLNSQYSESTDYVGDNVVVAPTTTTPTELKTIINGLGEEVEVVATDLHLSQPNRVINTEYVHAQIDKEVNYTIVEQEIDENITIKALKKSRYVILEVVFDYTNMGINVDANISASTGTVDIGKVVPDGFLPVGEIDCGVIQEGQLNEYIYTCLITKATVTSEGHIILNWQKEQISSNSYIIRPKSIVVGYQCQREN